jgi:uncharacterized protein YqeY
MKTKIEEDLKQAMRDKDSTKLNVLRGLKSAFTNASLQKGNVEAELSDVEIVNIVRKQFSQRQDSIKQFVEGQRFDLVAKEEVEMEILKSYLPEELSDLQLETYIVDSISELNATSKKDMGNVINRVVYIVNGRADNKRISKMVGEKLS